MRRTPEQAVADLRAHLVEWVSTGARPGVRVFVYPPEWEADMLERLASLSNNAAGGIAPLDIVDVGQGFLETLERNGLGNQLAAADGGATEWVLHDLGEIARQYLEKLLATSPDNAEKARLLVNTGALATFFSYSALLGQIGEPPASHAVALPTVIAFPGEGDESALNLLRLRSDTNYRVPRI